MGVGLGWDEVYSVLIRSFHCSTAFGGTGAGSHRPMLATNPNWLTRAGRSVPTSLVAKGALRAARVPSVR